MSSLRDLARDVVDRTPSRLIYLGLRAREVLAPRPWPHDQAAVELYRYENRSRGIISHPAYLYGLFAAARTARAVGATAVTALEFGVAGGNGLRAMQRYGRLVRDRWGIEVRVVGLDSGHGLLPSTDHRDCAFALTEGEFAMDQQALAPRLDGAELVLGPVERTVGPVAARIAAGELPPLGFVSHDLDVYTGTLAALRALGDLPTSAVLPRVTMYFDDLTGYPYTTETGERAAIVDFNALVPTRRIGRIENLQDTLGGGARWSNWPRHVHVMHAFDHPDYNAREQVNQPSLALRERSPNGTTSG